MTFAYLILAHDAFDQLEKLAARLLKDGPEDEVFIHVDGKAELPSGFLDGLAREQRARVHLLPRRTRVYWGHHSQCSATLALLEAALCRPHSHLHLLSGRDWPVATRSVMAADLARDAGTCFVDVEGPVMGWRMDRFCFEERILSPNRKPRPLLWRVDALVRRLGEAVDAYYAKRGLARPQPLGPWVKGSQWWSLPRDAAEHARDALHSLKQSGRLRFTQCSDEHVIPTALYNSSFRSSISGNRRFMVWPEGQWSPAVLTRQSPVPIEGSWFARKFDARVDDFFYGL